MDKKFLFVAFLIIGLLAWSKISSPTIVSPDKYLAPSPQAVPPGMEDTLFEAFINDPIAINTGFAGNTKRYLFNIERFYGDAAYGRVSGEFNGESVGGAEWRMNKYKNQWMVYFIGQQAPECKYLQEYAYLLHDWQAFCASYDSGKEEVLNVKHPDETYK